MSKHWTEIPQNVPQKVECTNTELKLPQKVFIFLYQKQIWFSNIECFRFFSIAEFLKLISFQGFEHTITFIYLLFFAFVDSEDEVEEIQKVRPA